MSLPAVYVNELNSLNRDVARAQPSDVLQFCANYFNRRLEEQRIELLAGSPTKSTPRRPGSVTFFEPAKESNNAQSPRSSQSAALSPGGSSFPGSNFPHLGSSPDHQQDFPTNYNLNRRTSVSAESLAPTASRDWSPPVIPKSDSQLQRLQRALDQNFLFKQLEEEQKSQILSALEEKEIEAGGTIIKQGDVGDYFYIVESGTFEVFVDEQKVNSIGPGGSFGELALMYNARRAATVTATVKGVLWALDRVTFRTILLENTFRKRKMYEAFLEEVPLLESLTPYERAKIADALEAHTYNPGETIIREGDVGDNFYIIESGDASVHRHDEGQVATLKKGDYFGELALLNDAPRAASVVARGRVKVVTLGKTGFQRLMGPVADIMKRQAPKDRHQ